MLLYFAEKPIFEHTGKKCDWFYFHKLSLIHNGMNGNVTAKALISLF